MHRLELRKFLRGFRAAFTVAAAGACLVACAGSSAGTPPARRAVAEVASSSAMNCRTSAFAGIPRATHGAQSSVSVPGTLDPYLPGVEISIQEEAGSMLSAVSVQIGPDGGDASGHFDFETRFDRMATHHAVPAGLLGETQTAKRRAVVEAAFPVICERADPSLERMLNRDSPLHWYEGAPQMPQNYVLATDRGGDWIEYLGATHRRLGTTPTGEFELLDQKGVYELRRSAHGAVLVDNQNSRFAWLYVYPGGAKLRAPSVVSGELIDEGARIGLAAPEFDRSEQSVSVNFATGVTTRSGDAQP